MKALTQAQVDQYRQDGATHPIRVFPAARAAAYYAELERCEAAYPDLRKVLRTKAHMALKWVDEIVYDPAVLDAVEDVLGPDILLYNLTVWIKRAKDPSFVSWHQDSAYFPLEPAEQVTAWVALTDSVEDNGNVKYIPGSHKRGELTHEERMAAGNMLSKGQTIAEDFDTSGVASILLQPGEMSLHHTWLLHHSEGNPSSRPRVGLGISYIPTSVRCTSSDIRLTAGLARGTDRYGHFEIEPRVRFDFDPAVEPFRQDAIDRYYRGRNETATLKRRDAAPAT